MLMARAAGMASLRAPLVHQTDSMVTVARVVGVVGTSRVAAMARSLTALAQTFQTVELVILAHSMATVFKPRALAVMDSMVDTSEAIVMC